jgi:plasmid stability protein
MERVKLTVRLPKQLHQILRERAAQSAQSLNKVIVDTLWRGLEREEVEEPREALIGISPLPEDIIMDRGER